jgi:hypothetical protein
LNPHTLPAGTDISLLGFQVLQCNEQRRSAFRKWEDVEGALLKHISGLIPFPMWHTWTDINVRDI